MEFVGLVIRVFGSLGKIDNFELFLFLDLLAGNVLDDRRIVHRHHFVGDLLSSTSTFGVINVNLDLFGSAPELVRSRNDEFLLGIDRSLEGAGRS